MVGDPFEKSAGKLLCLGAAITIAACLAAGAWSRPLVADNQLYFFMAERAAAGVPPHVSLVDSKNQLATLLSAGAIMAGRAVGLDDVRSTRALSIAAAACAVAATGALAGAMGSGAVSGVGSRAASLAGWQGASAVLAVLALLSTRGFVDHAAIGSNPKIFLAAFAAAAHLLCARRRMFGAGLAAACAFLCWQPALLVVAAIAGEALLAPGDPRCDGSRRTGVARSGARRLASVLAGAAIPVVLYEAYFAASGALVEQLDQAYWMTLGSVHEKTDWLASLLFVMTEARPRSGWPRLVPLVCAIGCVAWTVRAVGQGTSAVREVRQRAGWIAFGLAGAGATVFTLYDHQGIPDLFFPAPYFAVVAGLLTAAVARALVARGAEAAATAVAASVGAVLLFQLVTSPVQRARQGHDLWAQHALADELLTLRARHGDVWAYGAPHLLGLAHLDNWVAYGQLYDDVASRISIDDYRPLRDGRMPKLILRGSGPMPGSGAYLESEYDLVTPESFRRDGLRLYRRHQSS